MKTKELIKMLQEEDPSGELHVRVNGEMPFFAERKEGYWDGLYKYIEDDKLVFSTEGNKVDLHVLTTEDWVTDNLDDWEDKIDFRLHYLDNSSTIEAIKSNMREVADEVRTYEERFEQEFLYKMMERIKDGWKVMDYSKGDRFDPSKIYFEKSGEKERLMIGFFDPLNKFFKKEGKEWKLSV